MTNEEVWVRALCAAISSGYHHEAAVNWANYAVKWYRIRFPPFSITQKEE